MVHIFLNVTHCFVIFDHRKVVGILCAFLLKSCIIPMPIEQDGSEINYTPTYQFTLIFPDPSRVIEYNAEIEEGQPIQFDVGGLTDPNQEDFIF